MLWWPFNLVCDHKQVYGCTAVDWRIAYEQWRSLVLVAGWEEKQDVVVLFMEVTEVLGLGGSGRSAVPRIDAATIRLTRANHPSRTHHMFLLTSSSSPNDQPHNRGRYEHLLYSIEMATVKALDDLLYLLTCSYYVVDVLVDTNKPSALSLAPFIFSRTRRSSCVR